MTCNRNSVLLALTGITFLGLAGCGMQPYVPWQPEESKQAEEKAQMEAKPAQQTAPVSTSPSMAAEKSGSPPASQMKTSSSTTGDVLLIDSMQTAPDMQTPRNGMSMAAVRQQYGNPVSEGNRVGDPPITRWEYEGFSVYFEHDLVLHSVIHRLNQN